jgi:tyrosine-protein kinase Etk/Wzc
MEAQSERESFMYIRAGVQLFLQNWVLFLFSILAFTGLAIFINWYVAPQYEVSATLLLDENAGLTPDPSREFMKSFSIFTPVSDIQREILKMKSSGLIYEALAGTNSEISFWTTDGYRKRELYADMPFQIEIIKAHTQVLGLPFRIIFDGSNNFQLCSVPTDNPVRLFNYSQNKYGSTIEGFPMNTIFHSGDTVSNSFLSFRIITDKNRFSNYPQGSKFYFEFHSLDDLTYEFQKSIHIEQISKDIQAAVIKLKVRNPQQGIDFINALTGAYVKKNLENKNRIAESTIHYFDNQLHILEDSLRQAEERLQGFRSENKVMQISSKTDQVFKSTLDLENQKEDLEARLHYYEYIRSNLKKNKGNTNLLVPSAMGINDNVLNGLITDYMKLNTEINNLIKKKQTSGPAYSNMVIELDNDKMALEENITNLINTSNLQLNLINERLRKGNAEIKKLPTTERRLVGIERNYRLNDNLVNYMLEKKAEAQVAKASNLSKNDILEPARLTQLKPVSPNKILNLALAFLLGIGGPFALLGVRNTFSNKIVWGHLPSELSKLPSLGTVCHKKRKQERIVLIETPKSAISESMRGIRANVDYLLSGQRHQVIMLTSTCSGEGKSFNSLNLAVSLSLLNRKVILLDCDLRKPNLHRSLQLPNSAGLSSVLKGERRMEEVLLPTGVPFLDFLSAGPVPVNPAELLDSEASEQLLNQLKGMYDYVILDTPPMGLVSEAMLLMKYADLKILVVRQKTTPTKELSSLIHSLNVRQEENVCWLMNDVEIRNTGFGARNKYFTQN